MAILNNNPLVGASGNQSGYNINNSLRFRQSASAYLSRTPASAGNRNTWTWSSWIKRGNINTAQDIISTSSTGTSNTSLAALYFNASGNLEFFQYTSSTVFTSLSSTPLYRDPSAWYHIVVAYDDTQATASNRVKIYVNGNQVTAFNATTYPTQNYSGFINQAAPHAIGRDNGSPNANYLDGYLADVNFIDGSAKTPSDFGETDTTTGVWKPKAYTGTYGTNGFYLKFSDIATTSGSNAGLGKDFSGNANYWTTNNISVTAGTTYDAMTDSPTLTSATVANYCVLNPIDIIPSRTLPVISGGNLDASNGGSGDDLAHGTIAVSSGKWYFEMVAGTVPGASTHFVGWQVPVPSPINGGLYRSNGLIYDFSATSTSAPTYTANDIIGCMVDVDAGKVWFSKNGTYVNSGDPAAGTNPAYTFTAGSLITPALAFDNIASTCTASVNFGQRPFAYTPPTGFVALNTFNLPTPTILQGNKYMDATLYTGNGSSSRAITNSASFRPDFVWIKARSNAFWHQLYDASRGVQQALYSNATNAELTETTGLTAFNSNGFTVSSGSGVNENASTFVGWQWQAGQGSTSSNTSGSITSTVSVNTTAGFSVVTYTGNGTAGATVGHGLGVSPVMTIIKSRLIAGNSWCVWQKSFPTTQTLYLDGTTSLLTRDRMTGVSSTTFTIGSHTEVNTNSSTYVAYCWAEIAGFSRFGSYTGNGSADGPFVYTGFRPKYIVLKSTTTAGSNWWAEDTSRSTYNAANALLFPNLANAEYTTAGVETDILSNGFKLRTTNGDGNKSGDTFIYMAFAENPFKNALAR